MRKMILSVAVMLILVVAASDVFGRGFLGRRVYLRKAVVYQPEEITQSSTEAVEAGDGCVVGLFGRKICPKKVVPSPPPEIKPPPPVTPEIEPLTTVTPTISPLDGPRSFARWERIVFPTALTLVGLFSAVVSFGVFGVSHITQGKSRGKRKKR